MYIEHLQQGNSKFPYRETSTISLVGIPWGGKMMHAWNELIVQKLLNTTRNKLPWEKKMQQRIGTPKNWTTRNMNEIIKYIYLNN